jgi:hypothetical protein
MSEPTVPAACTLPDTCRLCARYARCTAVLTADLARRHPPRDLDPPAAPDDPTAAR